MATTREYLKTSDLDPAKFACSASGLTPIDVRVIEKAGAPINGTDTPNSLDTTAVDTSPVVLLDTTNDDLWWWDPVDSVWLTLANRNRPWTNDGAGTQITNADDHLHTEYAHRTGRVGIGPGPVADDGLHPLHVDNQGNESAHFEGRIGVGTAPGTGTINPVNNNIIVGGKTPGTGTAGLATQNNSMRLFIAAGNGSTVSAAGGGTFQANGPAWTNSVGQGLPGFHAGMFASNATGDGTGSGHFFGDVSTAALGLSNGYMTAAFRMVVKHLGSGLNSREFGILRTEAGAPHPVSQHYSKLWTDTAGEMQAMDQVGNVTQLTSWTRWAQQLLIEAGANPVLCDETTNLQIKRNVFTRRFGCTAGGYTIKGDIDSGAYKGYDSQGAEVSSGVSPDMAADAFLAFPEQDLTKTPEENWNAYQDKLVVESEEGEAEEEKPGQRRGHEKQAYPFG